MPANAVGGLEGIVQLSRVWYNIAAVCELSILKLGFSSEYDLICIQGTYLKIITRQ